MPEDRGLLLLVFDGDSVIVPNAFGTTEDKTWPHIVANGKTYQNLARHESTAAKVFTRIWQAIELHPRWYILQIGQWSQNHEVIREFEWNLRAIIEELNPRDIKVCLVTPGIQIHKRFNINDYCHVLRKMSGIYKTEFLDLNHLMSLVEKPDEWYGSDGIHFNENGFAKVAKLFNERIEL